MVPTTGEDIMGGTIGITEAAVASLPFVSTFKNSESFEGGQIGLTTGSGTMEAGASIGILCKYP